MVPRTWYPAAENCPDCGRYLCEQHTAEFRAERGMWGRHGRVAGYWAGPPGMGLLAALVTGLSVAGFVSTQTVAAAYRYHVNLGVPLVDLGGRPIYVPWAIVDWYLRFGGTARAVFGEAARTGLVAGALVGGVLFLAMFSRWMRWMTLRDWLS